jgi:hypothetical protein
MLWQAIADPQRFPLCGFAGTPSVGRCLGVTASREPSEGPGRRS